MRTALANSYNVPAVKALDHIGVYDDPLTLEPDGLVSFAERLGITTLTHDYYGLSLAIGGGEFSLLELTSAYATFANGGVHVPPYAITHVVDNEGNILYEYQPPPGNQVIRAEHAYLITSILSDNEARTPAFGPNSLLNLPFPVAAKTGTIDDFRDNWTFGYTPDLAVGVWLGNTDNTPMRNISGLTGAAPIWNQFMQIAIQLLSNGETIFFFMPPGVVEREICSASGTEPSEWCPLQRLEIFAIDQLPLPSSGDLWRNVLIDTWTGLFASPACDDFVDEKLVVNASDPWAVRWLQETSEGQAWAEEMGFASPVFILPTRGCSVSDPRPLLSFTSPYEGQTIRESPLQIVGVVDATAGFRRFRLEYGLGRDPLQWEIISERETPVTHSEVIYTWELSDMPSGELTLRLYMESTFGTYAEKRLHINIQP